MPALNQVKLSVRSDWQELQRMACALYQRIWKDEDIQGFGSQGQRRNGVDIFGSIRGTKKLGGVQCKCVSSFSEEELETEYREALTFTPKLSKYVIVTTPKRDTAVQRKSTVLSQEGGLRCTVMFWEEFSSLLAAEKDLLRRFFSECVKHLRTPWRSCWKLSRMAHRAENSDSRL